MEKDETLPLFLLFFHSFLNGLALVLFETTANTLFLLRYDIEQLPLVYILTALVSVGLGLLYTKLVENLSVQKLLISTMIFLSFIIFSFYIIIQILSLEFSYMGVMIFKDILWIFVGIEFGVISGIIFNIRQNKRLFGLLISGEILAGIIGGFSISFLVKYMDISQILVISGITMVLSFILLLNILNKFSIKFEENQIPKSELKKLNNSYLELLKNNYYLLFFLVSIFAFFVFYFIDYIFYLKVEEIFKDEKSLASFFGIFIALLNIVNLFSSIYLSGKILSRFGILFALSIIPILAIIGTSSYLILTGLSIGLAFFALIALKLLNEAFDTSLLTPTYKVIYQSIPAIHRNKILTFRESIVEPIAMGIAGVLLLILTRSEQTYNIYIIIISLSLLWLFFANTLKNNYILSLQKMLNKRRLFDDVNILSDIDIKFLLNKLKSDNEMDILYSLDFLGKLENKEFEDDLKILLKNNNPQIRKKVIETIGSLELLELQKELEEHLDIEKNTEILSLSIYTYANLLREEALKIVFFLDSKDKLIRNTTIIALIKYCGIDGEKIANEAIQNLQKDTSEEARLEILQIIKSAAFVNFNHILKDSLSHPSEKIKKEAIKTIGELNILEFVPDLLNLLQDKDYKALCILALRKYKGEISDDLIKEFHKTNIYEKKVSLIKLLAFTKTDKNLKFLFSQINYPIYKHNIIEALYQSNYKSNDKKTIITLIDNLIEQILKLTFQIENFNKKHYPNSYNLLKEEKKKSINSIFKALSFIYQKDIINQAKVNYSSSSKNFQILAIELLDNLIDHKIKLDIIRILENIDDNKKLIGFIDKVKYIELKNKKELFIKDIIQDQFSQMIVRLSLIYEVGKNKDKKYLACLKETIKIEKKPTMIETLDWAIKRF